MRSSEIGVVLHIGTHKTGSTALQTFCAANRDALADQGVLYPSHPIRWAGHHQLAWSLGVAHPYAEDIPAEELYDGVFAEAAERGCHTLLLSSEDFEFLPDPAVVRSALGDRRVQVVVYLRRQDDYLVSEYNQHVRMYLTRFTKTIGQFYVENDFVPRFDYERLLGKWAGAFGRESVEPRSYDVVRSGGRSIFTDFVEAAGLEWSNDFSLPGRGQSNVSLDPYATEVLRRINTLDLNEREHASMIRALQQMTVDRAFTEAFGEPPDVLGPGLRSELHQRYADSNDRVMAIYPALADPTALAALRAPEASADAGRFPPMEDLLLFIAPHLLRWQRSKPQP